MMDPDEAFDMFFLNLPPILDKFLLEKGGWEEWDKLTPAQRMSIQQRFESYAKVITSTKVST